MLVSNTPNVSIHNNAITDNTIYGVWSDTLTDATNNWWGNATGPNDNTAVPDACGLSIDNPAGTGSGASSCVLYDPWLVKNPFASAGSTVLPVGADGRPMMENQGEIPVFQVTSGQPTEISCGSQSVTLQIEDIKVTFTGLCGYEVVLDTISKDTLPSELGQGNNLEDGVTIRLLKRGESRLIPCLLMLSSRSIILNPRTAALQY